MTSLQQVNPRVRGIRVQLQDTLQDMAAHLKDQLSQGVEKPFKEVIDVSSSDSHSGGVKPITFVRQVLAACLYPELLCDETFPDDVRLRAQTFLNNCAGGNVGSYSTSITGLPFVKQRITEFITKRDAGVPAYPENIFLTHGSQKSLTMVIGLLVHEDKEAQTGVLTPLPCPHTLPMLLDLGGVKSMPYRLREDRGWAVGLEELQLAIDTARDCCLPRAIYINNPGNPTGYVQDRKLIEGVIRFAATENLLLLVEETYQDSVYGKGKEFISYKRVLFEMGREYSETVELISFYSLSNGIMGECGLRGGYMEVINMDPPVMHFLNVIHLNSSPILSQLALEVMVNPLKEGDLSYDTCSKEILLKQVTLAQNADRAWRFLNDLPGMSCQPAMAGLFVYPRLDIPLEMITGPEGDVLYCQRLLEEQGLCVGAGCDNGHVVGDHYLRLCVMVPPATLEEILARLSSFHLGLLDKFPYSERSVKDTDLGEGTA